MLSVWYPSRRMSPRGVFSRATRTAKDAVHSLLSRAGYYIDGRDGHYSLRRRIVLGGGHYLDVIRFAIGTPRVALVLGAYEGNGVREIANAFPRARVYGFEPDPDTYARFAAKMAAIPNAIPVQAAVGELDGIATLHRNRSADTNSLLPLDAQMTITSSAETAVEVPIDTLDTFCKRENIDVIDYVHADLQGYEMNMLRGAIGLLTDKRIRMILVEVCLDPMYVGQSRFEDLYAFMIEHGYRFVCTQGMFFDGVKPYPRSGNLIFVAA
jgi:FkbM family methyltransferase